MILKKWMPVLGKDHAQTNNLERDDDPKRNHLALESQFDFACIRVQALCGIFASETKVGSPDNDLTAAKSRQD
jgi:hypothetical protein